MCPWRQCCQPCAARRQQLRIMDIAAKFVILRATPRVPPAHIEYDNLRKVGCTTSMDPIQLQASISVFFRNGPRTRPAILCRAGCSYNCCVFEIWAPNTSRYPVSGRLFLQTSSSVFFRHGPRTRPAILCRAG